MNPFKRSIFIIGGILLLSSCHKHEGDWRSRYLGDYDFHVLKEEWTQWGNTYDTIDYVGRIYLPDDADESHTHLLSAPAGEEHAEVFIDFTSDQTINPALEIDGTFKERTEYGYFHSGEFDNPDEVQFEVRIDAGVAYGWIYKVKGTRVN